MGLSRATRHRGVLWLATALLPVPFLLTGCAGTDGGSSARAGGGATGAGASSAAPDPSAPASASDSASDPADAPASSAPPRSRGGSSDRCRTSELVASVGRGEAGAGQRSFAVALTNQSQRSCTLRGYPGAAFTDASGTQLGPDPRRIEGAPVTTVALS
ncbi:DUF4232 domain-containing protein, partial [Streptomyces sp. UH6]|uniref:DUF4232 domain-containing protein n=1 Tax=Streptomyces sp. UH6 TaxID=2748379 RepID=UPI0015D5168D